MRSRATLQLEILALRHQLHVLERSRPRRLRLTGADRVLWVWLSRVWQGWRAAMVIVTPETVIAWHRQGFRLFWRWKSRHRGRPTASAEVRTLIRTMSGANPLCGAPRIHGELLKLGIEISQATVGKYMIWHRRPPSQTWRTFLTNHVDQIMAADFFVVPTATDRLLFVPGDGDVHYAAERRGGNRVALTLRHVCEARIAGLLDKRNHTTVGDGDASAEGIVNLEVLPPRCKLCGIEQYDHGVTTTSKLELRRPCVNSARHLDVIDTPKIVIAH